MRTELEIENPNPKIASFFLGPEKGEISPNRPIWSNSVKSARSGNRVKPLVLLAFECRGRMRMRRSHEACFVSGEWSFLDVRALSGFDIGSKPAKGAPTSLIRHFVAFRMAFRIRSVSSQIRSHPIDLVGEFRLNVIDLMLSASILKSTNSNLSIHLHAHVLNLMSNTLVSLKNEIGFFLHIFQGAFPRYSFFITHLAKIPQWSLDPPNSLSIRLSQCPSRLPESHSMVLCKPSLKPVFAWNPNSSRARVVSSMRRGWPSGFVASHTTFPLNPELRL